MKNWFTFTIPFASEEAATQTALQDAFQRLWQNVLLRDPETCLFAGTPGPWGLRFYMAVPEEVPVQEHVDALNARKWSGAPQETQGVRLIVGPEESAYSQWHEHLQVQQERNMAVLE